MKKTGQGEQPTPFGLPSHLRSPVQLVLAGGAHKQKQIYNSLFDAEAHRVQTVN